MLVKKIARPFFISIILFFLLAVFIAAQEPTFPPPKGAEPTPGLPVTSTTSLQINPVLLSKIEPQLLKKLFESKNEPAPFIVYLKAQVNTTAVASEASAINAQTGPDPLVRRTAIVDTLQKTARNTQGGVLQALNTPPPGGGVNGQSTAATDINPLWIVNAVAARGSIETVLALAARPDVQIVRLDKEIKISRPLRPESKFYAINTEFPQRPNLQGPEWGISKIRANLVHDALGIDGTGIVVANIDSGVDGFHPALQAKYRGYTGPGKLPIHDGNWYDATGSEAVYPVDGNGHGTHTMGTMVGDGGIGVAPGATWIAARAFNNTGSALNSWLHEAFQWILAPDEDPGLAPHIVNNSWGSNNGFITEFESDVQALLNAGIYLVFSAGNNGPGSGTVGSPGSYAFAVGATTIDDEIAAFSSRGPSPWGQVKPEVSAPGKNIRSSVPGGAYTNFDGTSMAAPHTSGLAALLLQASPTLTTNLGEISKVMTSTAVQLGTPIPNNNFGWGRIDAYNAVMSVVSAGALAGQVTGEGLPINSATIRITPHGGGATVNTASDTNGDYRQGLAANTYDVTASAFGYVPSTTFGIVIVTNTTTTQHFDLAALPTGTLQGTIKGKISNSPLSATVTIKGTPAETTSNPVDGSYKLSLPVGVYTATVIAAEHRISQVVNITINQGATVTQDFLLKTGPSILLVDSGKWYQESQIGYYQQALADAWYTYDTWQISDPFGTPNDIPISTTLVTYDIVVWSAPEDSPGYIGAGDEIEDYLDGGGKLLLSGQDIAYYDSGNSLLPAAPYLKNYIKADYVADDSGIRTIAGVANEPFDGFSVSITGGDGADNQLYPDVIANADRDFAGSLLAYSADNLAGLHIGLCVPYRAMFFAFGFEAINSRTDRSQVIEQTIDWLMQSPNQSGVELTPEYATVTGNFGTTISHTVRIRNTGTNTDVISLASSNGIPYNWTQSSVLSSVSLASCQSENVSIDIQMPSAKTWHISDTFTLSAQSTNNPTLTDIATRTTKTPAPVLLVDDDRWYSFAEEFKEALETNSIGYDYWRVPKSWIGPVPPSPPLETLQMYPMTVWYTAYDWFQPLTPAEEDRLAGYLDGGGRLLFSSQDFLYKHLVDHGDYDTFAQDYLGVQAHTEDFSSTLIIGQPKSPVGDYLGPYALTFPPGYKNWTDALTPTTSAQVATLGQAAQPNSLANAGAGSGSEHWHTNFLAYGPELLSSTERARLMQRSLGWLSWLGDSTVVPGISTTLDGTNVTYTATVANNGLDDLSTAHFTATFPTELTPGNHSPALTPSGDNLVWSGPLAKNQSKVFTYTATIAGSLPLGTVISQTSWLAYPDHNILFDRIATVNVNFPNLTASTLTVAPNEGVEANGMLVYSITLKNNGLVDDPTVTTTNTLPHMLDLISVDTPSQGNIESTNRVFTWTTPLSINQVATLTYRALISYETSSAIQNTAYINDDINDPIVLSARATFKIFPTYLPVILKD